MGEIGCALGRERERRVDNCGCLLRETNEKKFSLGDLRVRQFDDTQDDISEMVDLR